MLRFQYKINTGKTLYSEAILEVMHGHFILSQEEIFKLREGLEEGGVGLEKVGITK